MTGRWIVKRIVAKDGTIFPWWRVQNPTGKTEMVLRDRLQALTFANRTAWHEAWIGVVRRTWSADDIFYLTANPAKIDCPVCHVHYPITAEHLNCAGPQGGAR